MEKIKFKKHENSTENNKNLRSYDDTILVIKIKARKASNPRGGHLFWKNWKKYPQDKFLTLIHNVNVFKKPKYNIIILTFEVTLWIAPSDVS